MAATSGHRLPEESQSTLSDLRTLRRRRGPHRRNPPGRDHQGTRRRCWRRSERTQVGDEMELPLKFQSEISNEVSILKPRNGLGRKAVEARRRRNAPRSSATPYKSITLGRDVIRACAAWAHHKRHRRLAIIRENVVFESADFQHRSAMCVLANYGREPKGSRPNTPWSIECPQSRGSPGVSIQVRRLFRGRRRVRTRSRETIRASRGSFLRRRRETRAFCPETRPSASA
jgi:hypothetical protein